MALSATPTSPAPDELAEVVLDFPDNWLLIDLCGEFDRNLAAIEDRLGVQILRRGNRLAVVGDAAERGAEVLRALYGRLEPGRGLEPGDIDATMRMGPWAAAPAPARATRSRCSRGGAT